LVNAEASFNLLATRPLMGAPLALKHPELTTMRKWRVDGFDNHLLLSAADRWNRYRPRASRRHRLVEASWRRGVRDIRVNNPQMIRLHRSEPVSRFMKDFFNELLVH
jgi:hypothetical protein